MARRRDRERRLEQAVIEYHQRAQLLPGVATDKTLASFVGQLVESTRRTEYVRTMLGRDVSVNRADPLYPGFDPVLGAIVKIRADDYEEACWLAFLSVHCGRSRRSAWELCRAIYGRLGRGPVADWPSTRCDVSSLGRWIERHADAIRFGPPVRQFGNHRKYESLVVRNGQGTPMTLKSYVDWVSGAGSHKMLFDNALAAAAGDKYNAFNALYCSMDAVSRFGRLAKFDYLSMIGKLGLAPISAGSTYLGSSTGPLRGAALLFTAGKKAAPAPRAMDTMLRDLGEALEVTMQDLEDAVCNWQKSPDAFKSFRG